MGEMDKECIALCNAMNKMPGIATHESCCGHGKEPYRIWFGAKNLGVLPPLLYWFDGCHCGFYGWHVEVGTDCTMRPAQFMVEGPGEGKAYEEALVIANYLEEVASGEGK